MATEIVLNPEARSGKAVTRLGSGSRVILRELTGTG